MEEAPPSAPPPGPPPEVSEEAAKMQEFMLAHQPLMQAISHQQVALNILLLETPPAVQQQMVAASLANLLANAHCGACAHQTMSRVINTAWMLFHQAAEQHEARQQEEAAVANRSLH